MAIQRIKPEPKTNEERRQMAKGSLVDRVEALERITRILLDKVGDTVTLPEPLDDHMKKIDNAEQEFPDD
ncbi:hypothetical protein D6779_07050 [Candidatus Parcubacteria bacterium]|nr:MAG: hypothetical protein D6779_07050 [Candidatus Parcubacteria bacterium]